MDTRAGSLALACEQRMSSLPSRLVIRARGRCLKTLQAARQAEMEARAALGAQRRQTGQCPPGVGDGVGLEHRIANYSPAVGGGIVQAVGQRSAPVYGRSIDACQTVLDTHQAAQVARVAIRIPSGGVDYHQRFLEIIVTVE